MKKVLDYILPIRKFEAAYAIIFALMCIMSMHVINEEAVHSNVLTTYVTSFRVVDILLLLVIAVAVYMILQLLRFVVNHAGMLLTYKGEVKTRPLVVGIGVFVIIMITWIPYFMSYWPGGIYNDTLYSIHIALGEQPMDNQNTVLYALFWRLIFWIGNIANQWVYGGMKLMTILQAVMMASSAAAFMAWLRKKTVRIWVISLLTALFALMPIFPLYSISLWKDTPFGVIMFLYSWLMYVIVIKLNKEKAVLSRSDIVKYILLSALVIFGRNNGIYIVIAVSVALALFIHIAGCNKDKKIIILTSVSVIAASLIIQIPVYNACGVEQSDPVEKYGIPIQQTAYIISSAGKISDSEREVFDNILPMDGWINLYNPIVVDPIKFDPLFNSEYFNANTGKFVKAYAGIVVKNPVLAVKGYLLSTIGFWDVWKTSSSAYYCNTHCYGAEFYMSDYFSQKTGILLTDIVGPRWVISSGLLIWIMLWAVSFILQKRYYRMLMPIIPTLALWCTLLIATPLAFSFRYVFSLLLCLPIYFISAGRQLPENGIGD